MKIRKEGYRKEDILKSSLKIFKEKFINFTKNINKIDEIFDKIYTPLVNTGKRLSACGLCNRFMLLIDQKVPILSCLECNKDYKLIKNIENLKSNNHRCPICKFETISFKFNDKENILCPYCFNNPNQEYTNVKLNNYTNYIKCHMCNHKECNLSLNNRILAECKYCNKGKIALREIKGDIET